ncbi:MAG TPA: DUF2167 domain-containing protein [Candidatus Acidoferrales bacterium]
MAKLLRTGALLGSLLGIPPICLAQATGSPINWQTGPVTGKLGEIAQIVVPKGYRFTDKAGAQKLLEITQNPSDGDELGALIPVLDKGADIWFVVFEFDDSGYIRDNEKDNLDANAMLESIKKATEESNKAREQKGWPDFHVVEWSHAPYYDPLTHNLTWAILGESQVSGKPKEQAVNYSVRLLGKSGVMKADLVLEPQQVSATVPEFQGLLDGFSFTPGNTYAEWRSGDKVAKYGLTALVVGGAATAALKTGLLLKFWKLIVAAFLAFVAFLKRIYAYIKRLLTGKAGEEPVRSE